MTTEEKAKAYADKKIKSTYGISSKAFREAGCRLEYEDVVQAYEDGATEALASQWVSVEERLPEYNATCLIRGKDDDRHWWMHFAWFDGENFYDAQTDRLYRPLYWFPIPPLKGGSDTFNETDK